MYEDGRYALQNLDRTYRRGLVLGLTVAELFLLLLFLLLLALAALLVAVEAEKEELRAERDRAVEEKKELVALKSIRDQLSELGMRPDQIETLIESTKQTDELKQQVSELERALDEMRPAAELGRAVEEAAEAAHVDPEVLKKDPSVIAEAIKDAARLSEVIAERDRLRDNLNEAVRAVDRLAESKGIDPSCWYQQVTDEARNQKEQVVWLFDVAVHDQFLVVRDREVSSQFVSDKKALPISGIPFGDPLTDSEFLSLMRPIRTMAKEERRVREYSCVFYVGVWDRTSPGAKERWKRATEGTIGAVFYRQTVNGQPW